MKIAFLVVVIVGALIGFALPQGSKPAVASLDVPEASAADASRDTVLDRSSSGHFIAVVEINGEPVRFVVDTGADTVALTEADAKRAHVAFDPQAFRVVGRGASGDVAGEEVQIRDIALDGKRASNVRGVVLADSDISLLGQSYLRHLHSVEISGDTMRLH